MEAAAAVPPSSVVSSEEEYALASSSVDQMPPGFRFHPTDWEIINYLLNKIIDTRFRAVAIGEIDLNKCEPWDLPQKAPKMGEKEWFFFFEKETKYPSGMRTNRATASGYWKATGKDKEIHKGKMGIVGMKKTLVFYKGRAPKGEKTNWIIHEYRLKGEFSAYNLSADAKEKWVVCRVFHKKTVQTNPSVELSRIESSFVDHYLVDSPIPLLPLTDYSSSSLTGKPTSTSASQENDQIKPTTCSSTLMLNSNKLKELQHHQINFLFPHLKMNSYNQYYSTLHNLNPEPDYSTRLGHINSFLPYESPSLAYQHQDGLCSSSMMEWYLANFPIKGGDEKPNSRILAPDIYIGGKEPESVCKMEPISFNNSEISTEVAAAEMNCEKESESKNAVAEDLCFSPNISELDSLWSY